MSPLARLTNTDGEWVDAISNFSSALEARVFLLVLGSGEGWENAKTGLCDNVVTSPAGAEDEEPSLASATGISSKDSAESELYAAGGAAAWTGPEAAKGGRETLIGNAGKGSRWARDTVDTPLDSVGGKQDNRQEKLVDLKPTFTSHGYDSTCRLIHPHAFTEMY